MNQNELDRKGIDLKLVFLLLLRKTVYVILSALAAAVLFGGGYAIWYHISNEARLYEAESKYELVFEEIPDKTYFDYYYNGYTWNDLLKTDPFMEPCMEELKDSGYTRVQIEEAVKAEILSDVRILTTTVSMKTPEEAKLVQKALENAVLAYADKGEYLESIQLLRSGEPVLKPIENQLLRAALTGAAIGVVLCILVLLLWLAIDDAVYLPKQFEERYGIPNAGMKLRENQKLKSPVLASECKENLKKNLQHLAQQDGALKQLFPVVSPDTAASELNYENYRSGGGVIIEYPQGSGGSRKLDALVENLKRQDCRIICGIMTDVDAMLIRSYYGIHK